MRHKNLDCRLTAGEICCEAAPFLKEFASLMLFLVSYPPAPFPHGKGGTHRSGFSSYEGAAATAGGGRNERSSKTPEGVLLLLFVCARSARGASEVVETPRCHIKGVRHTADGLSRHLDGDVITPYPLPLPLPDGEGSSASPKFSEPPTADSQSRRLSPRISCRKKLSGAYTIQGCSA